MSLDSDLVTPWLVISITGQWCLLALLITFAVAKHLPQRKNPFLINFVLTTFLSTIPPTLLLYTGKQYGKASNGLCFVQAALVDGVAPMFGVAQVALVLDTWLELRECCLGKLNHARRPAFKYILIFTPYLVFWIWTFSSFIAARQSKAARYDGYVYCVMNSGPSSKLRDNISVFMLLAGLAELILEFCVCWVIYHRRKAEQKHSTAWRSTLHFASRLLILGLLQLIVVFLALINIKLNSSKVKFAYDLMMSGNALATFIAFGTQRSILQTWKFWGKRTNSFGQDGSRPTSCSSQDSSHILVYTPKSMRSEADSPDPEKRAAETA